MNIILRVAAFLLLAVAVAPAYGQSPLGLTGVMSGGSKTDSAQRQATDDDLAELLRLLSNPALVEKLRQRSAETASQSTDGGISSSGVEKYFQEILSQIETRGSLIAQALLTVPQLSGALAAAWSESMAASEFLRSAIHIIIFLFGGFGLEWLYWSYLSGTLKRIELSKPESYGTILKAAMLRATLLFGSIAVFAFGSIGLFVAFEWSAFVEDIVISLLVGIILMRLIIMIGVFVLAPNVNDLRLLPLDKAAARNIYRWVLAVSGIGLLGVLVVDTIDRMAIAAPSLLAVEFIAASRHRSYRWHSSARYGVPSLRNTAAMRRLRSPPLMWRTRPTRRSLGRRHPETSSWSCRAPSLSSHFCCGSPMSQPCFGRWWRWHF